MSLVAARRKALRTSVLAVALAAFAVLPAGGQSLPDYKTCTISGGDLMVRSVDAGTVGRLDNIDFNPDFVLVDTDRNLLSLVRTDQMAFRRVDCERAATVSTLTEIAPRSVDLLFSNTDLSVDIAVTGLARTAVFFGDGEGGANGTGMQIGDVDDGSAVVAADIDDDGLTDLVTGTVGGNDVEVALAASNAPRVVALDVDKTVVDVAVSDFDGDGLLDVMVLASNEVQLFRQDPDPPPTPTGTPGPVDLFGAKESVLPTDNNLQLERLVVAALDTASEIDFNDDGIPDVAIVGNDIQSGGELRILLGSRSGGYDFGDDTSIAISGGPVDVAIGDLDRDDDVDLVVAQRNSNQLQIFLNDGNGNFDAAGSGMSTAGQPGVVLVADVDGDGTPDIAAGSEADGSLTMFLSNAFPIPSFTLTPTLTETPIPTQSATPTETPTSTPTATPSVTETPSVTRTLTPTITTTPGLFEVRGDGCAAIVEAEGSGGAWPLLVAGLVGIYVRRRRGVRSED